MSCCSALSAQSVIVVLRPQGARPPARVRSADRNGTGPGLLRHSLVLAFCSPAQLRLPG